MQVAEPSSFEDRIAPPHDRVTMDACRAIRPETRQAGQVPGHPVPHNGEIASGKHLTSVVESQEGEALDKATVWPCRAHFLSCVHLVQGRI